MNTILTARYCVLMYRDQEPTSPRLAAFAAAALGQPWPESSLASAYASAGEIARGRRRAETGRHHECCAIIAEIFARPPRWTA